MTPNEKSELWKHALAKLQIFKDKYSIGYIYDKDVGPALIKSTDEEYPTAYLYFNNTTNKVELLDLPYDRLTIISGKPYYIALTKYPLTTKDGIDHGIMSLQGEVLIPATYDWADQIGEDIYAAANHAALSDIPSVVLYRGNKVIDTLYNLDKQRYLRVSQMRKTLAIYINWINSKDSYHEKATIYFVYSNGVIKLEVSKVIEVKKKYDEITEITCIVSGTTNKIVLTAKKIKCLFRANYRDKAEKLGCVFLD